MRVDNHLPEPKWFFVKRFGKAQHELYCHHRAFYSAHDWRNGHIAFGHIGIGIFQGIHQCNYSGTQTQLFRHPTSTTKSLLPAWT